jgi:putative redox protein
MTTVVVRGGAALRQEIEVRGKILVADEPVDVGGTDDGPTPYELLLGALGSCTAMTIVLYARRQGWAVNGVTVELEHGRVHEKDCEDCEEPGAYLDRISKRITVDGPLHEDQRARLEEISRRCPVQKTLTGRLRIEDELVLGAYSP